MSKFLHRVGNFLPGHLAISKCENFKCWISWYPNRQCAIVIKNAQSWSKVHDHGPKCTIMDQSVDRWSFCLIVLLIILFDHEPKCSIIEFTIMCERGRSFAKEDDHWPKCLIVGQSLRFWTRMFDHGQNSTIIDWTGSWALIMDPLCTEIVPNRYNRSKLSLSWKISFQLGIFKLEFLTWIKWSKDNLLKIFLIQ